MHRFQIIPVFLRTAAPGDILVATQGNFSILRPPKVLAAQNIVLPPLVNSSDLNVGGHARIYLHEGIVDDIVLPALSETSVLGSGSPFVAFVEISEASPDGNIRLPTIVNESNVFGIRYTEEGIIRLTEEGVVRTVEDGITVAEAPSAGFIRLPVLTNSSVLTHGSPIEANVVVSEEATIPTEADDDSDSMVAGGMIGGRMI